MNNGRVRAPRGPTVIARIARRAIPTVAAGLTLAGCWTFDQSAYPEVAASRPSGAAEKASVAVTGFETTVINRSYATSYHTVWVPEYYGRDCYGRGYYGPGHHEVLPSTTVVEYPEPSKAFRERAEGAFADAGWTMGAQTPDWTVDMTFAGPTQNSGDVWRTAGWFVCSIFFCDYEAKTWQGKLRIRDNRTGKLAFSRDYTQRYETKVFGLIPLFSVSCCKETDDNYVQGWCLAAITDRAVADATAFLNETCKK